LPESFIVDMVGPNFSRSLTIHRPIGCTPDSVDDDRDWIISDPSAVEQLLSAADDPGERELAIRRAARRLELAMTCAQPLLQADADGLPCYPTSGYARAPVVKAARAAFKAEAKRLGHDPPDGYAFFMPVDTDRDEEVALENFYRLPTTVAAVKVTHPDTGYVTRSGPLQDQDQVPCTLYQGLSARTLQNRVYRDIASMGRPISLTAEQVTAIRNYTNGIGAGPITAITLTGNTVVPEP
jgi:hypothetical protein